MENIVEIDLKVSPRDVPYDLEENQNYGIHTHEVRKEDIDTDEMFNESPIVNVQWFETEEERDANIK